MTRTERVAYWRGLVAQQSESGLKAAAFCREHQINLHLFYRWRHRFRDKQLTSESAGFFELVPCAQQVQYPGSGIRIRLGNTLSIEVERGFDPVTLRAVIETISSGGKSSCLP
jgi:hypothetical protein